MQKEMSAQTAVTKPELLITYGTRESARYACLNYHYSKRVPAVNNCIFNVYEDGAFVGAILFGRGGNNNAARPFGLPSECVCELTRVALRAHITPVTKMLSVCLSKIKKDWPVIKLIVSYADLDQGHEGKIYRAGNWTFLGHLLTNPPLFIEGRKVQSRAVSKGLSHKGVVYPTKGKNKYIYWLDKAAETEWKKKAPKKGAMSAEVGSNAIPQLDAGYSTVELSAPPKIVNV